MQIVSYDKKYKADFIQFNTDWIVDNFGALEQEDIKTFENLEQYLSNGSMIYFAVDNGIVLATCMAMKMNNDTWEMCKLASNKHVNHSGAGSAVFEAAMKYAIEHGAKRLFLLSNRKLKPALHIYKKYGFQEIKLGSYEYTRGDIAFEYMVEENCDEHYIMNRIAPCGLHCGKCFAFNGGKISKLSAELKKELGNFEPYAKRFSRQLSPIFDKFADFSEMLTYFSASSCNGCRKEHCKFYKNCKVRQCTADKKVDFCYQCDEFPCNHTGLDENLYKRSVAINRNIKEIGLSAYYEKIKNLPRYE